MLGARTARAARMVAMRQPVGMCPPLALVGRRWNQQASADSNKFADLDAMRRSLLYRSKQRGALLAADSRC